MVCSYYIDNYMIFGYLRVGILLFGLTSISYRLEFFSNSFLSYGKECRSFVPPIENDKTSISNGYEIYSSSNLNDHF